MKLLPASKNAPRYSALWYQVLRLGWRNQVVCSEAWRRRDGGRCLSSNTMQAECCRNSSIMGWWARPWWRHGVEKLSASPVFSARANPFLAWTGCSINELPLNGDTMQLVSFIYHETINSEKHSDGKTPCRTVLDSNAIVISSWSIHKKHTRTIGRRDVTVVNRGRQDSKMSSRTNRPQTAGFWSISSQSGIHYQDTVLFFDGEDHYRQKSRRRWRVFRISAQEHIRGTVCNLPWLAGELHASGSN